MLEAERRQALLEIVCERRSVKYDVLARELNVCRKTIQRDVMILSPTYPIYTTTGHFGGVHVMDGFYLSRSSRFTQEQLDLLNKLHGSLTGKEKDVMASIIKYGGGRVNNECI